MIVVFAADGLTTKPFDTNSSEMFKKQWKVSSSSNTSSSVIFTDTVAVVLPLSNVTTYGPGLKSTFATHQGWKEEKCH